ncbi:alginate export family protein [Nitrosomonas communis]|uniref:alginate export family protein n=1 Tax=Nitrosomonas communis TaxID=44574 RepID=UPI0026EAE921|nr:alginate export family protein [Nitrosomonas communis]MCO6429129.1 alginate export family protein [Nitrosomonas communis]
MMQKNMQIICKQIVFMMGCFMGSSVTLAAEAKNTEAVKAEKSSIIVRNDTAPNGAPFSVEETPGRFRFDFDRLTKLMEADKTPLAAMAPDWLNLAIEHRTRYDVYDHGFTRAIPDGNEQIHQRTRFLFEIQNIIDPFRFTLELTDFRAPLAEHGQEHSPIFANHFDFTQLHLDLISRDFLGTGYGAKFEVGRLILEYGESRLVGGHRWGTFTPTFDGIRFSMGNDKEKWGLHVFGTRPVNREVSELDWNTPESYFSGAQITNRDLRWANTDVYWFQLNEGNKLRQRNLSTPGFRLFAKPVKGNFDYEIESIYQFGDTQDIDIFAHRHHGEIGYSFETAMPFRLVYLFDYASGDQDPRKNFDILYAKRRVEYGPTGMFGPFFPSNLFSPVGFRAVLLPVPNVRLMMSHRAYWLANKRGPYVGSGLQDPTGRSGSFLGNMLDISLGWDPQWSFLKRVSFDIGFSHIFKGDYFEKVPNSPGTAGTNYGYTMATLKF